MITPVESITAQRILVVAPHPDDEALGCGGLIALLARADRKFHLVFVTDGGASHPGSQTWPRERLATQREEEANRSLALLGLERHPRVFLRLRDSGMPSLTSEEGKQALSRLTGIARSFMPELVLLPWRRDPHCDHRDAWMLTHQALAAVQPQPATLEYAVWLDEFGAVEDHPSKEEAERVSFDITRAVAIKRSAIEAHASQTTDLIDDDSNAFRLSQATIERLCGPTECYWRPLP